MNFLVFLFFSITLIYKNADAKDMNIDPNGYIVFCPCMGRFGNQMDQFLGALAFAKGIERTLVLPHLVEYPDRFSSSVQIPFQTYFKVEPLNEYTKVVLMDDFMKYIAPKVWPKGNRTVFCYMGRGDSKDCSAKDGNPFGPYWNNFGIDFDNDVFYGPLGYDPTFGNHKVGWMTKYSPEKYPVLAFTGAPGAFPVLEKHVFLQKYLKWSDFIDSKAEEFINKLTGGSHEKFIGIHLRNGVDFKRACEHVKTSKSNFFASPQCLGYHQENGEMTEELCYPSEKTIFKQLDKVLKKYDAQYVFIATDAEDMLVKLSKKFKHVKFIKYPENNPHVDICILGKADHTIVNCVSSFSAFIKRQRDSENKTTEFWGFKAKKKIEQEL
ncbi:unnamed protein product [Brachionus calyciflorus]|uniref:GDP-fucose protein O-fucosyltransferase 1 n=1 Tax=Brachionus calyciflorus TaxID=104777 RepID=A0A814EPZ4_9BILA|nr:unnamed protein product [Brachionus calyciflorus]